MDPRLMKLLGITFQAPAGDEGGEDGADHHESNDEADEDDEEDEGDEDADEDDEEDEGDEDADETDEEEESEEEEDDDLGDRAHKRINKLLARSKDAEARVKALEKQLEDARKLSGDDGKAIIKAAERSGILPGLMSKDEANAFEALEQYPRVIENYQDWLDEHESGDEFGDGENAMSYGQVKKRVRQLTSELQGIQDEYGDRRKELKKKVREIFEAGIEALKNGYKPGAKKKTEKKDRKETKLEQKPKATGLKPKRRSGRLDDMEVDSEEDLEAYITEMRRKKD